MNKEKNNTHLEVRACEILGTNLFKGKACLVGVKKKKLHTGRTAKFAQRCSHLILPEFEAALKRQHVGLV